jgi:hypothetical protein
MKEDFRNISKIFNDLSYKVDIKPVIYPTVPYIILYRYEGDLIIVDDIFRSFGGSSYIWLWEQDCWNPKPLDDEIKKLLPEDSKIFSLLKSLDRVNKLESL